MPDSVEILAAKRIQLVSNKSGNDKFYFLLGTETGNVYRLTIISYRENESTVTGSWVSSSNRFVNVDKMYYPVLTSFDFTFATTDPNNIGEYGNRDGYVRKVYLIAHDYSIVFNNGTGRIVRVENE